MTKQIVSALVLSLSLFAGSAQASETEKLTSRQVDHMSHVLGLEERPSDENVLALASSVFSAFGTLSCRDNGFSCTSGTECCTYCSQGTCGGSSTTKPDGADCESSSECKTYCSQGTCGGSSTTKPDGSRCQSSSECKSYCSRGRCGGV